MSLIRVSRAVQWRWNWACDKQGALVVVGKRCLKTIYLQTSSAMTRFLSPQYSRQLSVELVARIPRATRRASAPTGHFGIPGMARDLALFV